MSSRKKEKSFQQDSIQPLSSIPLQTLLYFNYIYSMFYFVCEGMLFIYKAYGLFYPTSTLSSEIILLLFFAIIQFTRIHFGTLGNKTESVRLTFQFIIMGIIEIVGYVYFMGLQQYILMIEFVLGVIGGAFLIFEIIFAALAVLSFSSFEKMH